MIKNTRGQIIIIALVFMGVITALSASFVTYQNFTVRQARREFRQAQALNLAEAGINKAIWSLNQGGYSGETTALGAGTFVVTVKDIDSRTKAVEATGYVPDPNQPLSSKTVNVLVGREPPVTTVIFDHALQAGDGGLELGDGTTVNGSVYSHGNIVGNGKTKSIINGHTWVAGGNAAESPSWTVNNSDFIFGQKSPIIDAAQSFTVTSTQVLNKVSLLIKKVGKPDDRALRIVAADAASGNPGVRSLADANIKSSRVSAEYSWVEVSFPKAPRLAAGAYWLVFDAKRDSAKYWVWAKDSSDGYPGGTGKSSASWDDPKAKWQSAGGDLNFKIWLGGVITRIEKTGVNGDAFANTIKDSAVGGDAYYQTLTNTTVGGASNPGSPDPGPQDQPISEGNIADWKRSAEAGGVITGDFKPPKGGATMLGPKKITGNLLLIDNQTLILTGTVWVQGSIEIDNNATVRLDPAYNDKSGVIISDGAIHMGNNGVFSGSGHPDSFLMFLTLAKCKGAAGVANCTHHDGAVDVHNRIESSVIYAPDGLVYLHDNVEVQELTAYKLSLSNNITVNYRSGLKVTQFVSEFLGPWQFLEGTWRQK